MYRFFIHDEIVLGELVIAEKESFHMKVMRVRPNQKIILVNGRQQIGKAFVTALNSRATVSVYDVTTEKGLFTHELALGMVKQPLLENVLVKATEIGVDTFHIFFADNSIKKSITKEQIARLDRLLVAAIKQSDRLYKPALFFYDGLAKIDFANKNIFHGDILGCKVKSPKGRTMVVVGPQKRAFLRKRSVY